MDLHPVTLDLRQNLVEADNPVHYAGANIKLSGDLSFRTPIFATGLVPRFISFTVGVSKLPENCYVASIQYGGREITEFSEYIAAATLDIAIASDGGVVKGQTTDKDGKASPGAVVALVPVSGKGAPHSLVSDSNGAFQFSAIPPGEYKLYAFDDVGGDDIVNAEFLARFDGQTLKVAAGETGTATAVVLAGQ